MDAKFFLNGLQTIVNRILLKSGKSLEYIFPCMVTDTKISHVQRRFASRCQLILPVDDHLDGECADLWHSG